MNALPLYLARLTKDEVISVLRGEGRGEVRGGEGRGGLVQPPT